jgi:uncharacterized protein YoxC
MSEIQETMGEVASVIQEIEKQLENLLSKKREDIERALAARIQKEKEAAHKRVNELEKEFDQEREAIDEFRTMVGEVEAERNTILEEVRERIKHALQFQAEVENLSRQTAEEIRKVNDLHQKLESLRQRTADRAGFLKKDLREKFGIVTEVPEQEDVLGPEMDLDRELENLKRIKTLLAGELPSGGGEGRPRKEGGESWELRIPEIRDLIQSSHFQEDGETKSVPIEDGPGGKAPQGVIGGVSVVESLNALGRTDPADGSGEIRYFQKRMKVVLDPEHLLGAIERSVEESRKLSFKLGETESAKDRFFIKHELINAQEGLRKLVFRAIKICDKKPPALPGVVLDVLNVKVLRNMLDRLSTDNWANPEDLASFEKDIRTLTTAFRERTVPREKYFRSILEELEGG